MQNYVDRRQIEFHGYHSIKNSRFSGKKCSCQLKFYIYQRLVLYKMVYKQTTFGLYKKIQCNYCMSYNTKISKKKFILFFYVN